MGDQCEALHRRDGCVWVRRLRDESGPSCPPRIRRPKCPPSARRSPGGRGRERAPQKCKGITLTNGRRHRVHSRMAILQQTRSRLLDMRSGDEDLPLRYGYTFITTLPALAQRAALECTHGPGERRPRRSCGAPCSRLLTTRTPSVMERSSSHGHTMAMLWKDGDEVTSWTEPKRRTPTTTYDGQSRDIPQPRSEKPRYG